MIYHVPYCLFVPDWATPPDPENNKPGILRTGFDGYGDPVDGREQPLFDTLLAIFNPNSVAVSFQINIFDQDGNALVWPNGGYSGDYTLRPGRHLSTTFIKGNIFPNPVQDFVGQLQIVTTDPLVVHCFLGGGGVGPGNWNGYSPAVPVYCDTGSYLSQRYLEERAEQYLAYSIQFEDANHNAAMAAKLGLKDFAYCSGIVLMNIDYGRDVWAHVDFVVGETYPKQGTVYKTALHLPPRKQIVKDLTQLFPDYPAGQNAEGTVVVRLRESADLASPLKPAWFVAFSIAQNRGCDSFSAGCAYQ